MNRPDHSIDPVLGTTLRDRAVALSEGAMERLEGYVRLLGERLRNVEQDDLRNRFRDPENIDLFEDGAVQAARALSEERRAYLAAVVARGISGDARVRLEAKRLLVLLREIDDSQVIFLASHLSKN